MNNKNRFIVSLIIMIITVLCMGISFFIWPLPDIVVRVIGVIMLIDIAILGYSTVKLRNSGQ